MICIYVAIGQKASTVAKLVTTLENKRGHGVHHRGVAATASDSAPLQYHRALRGERPWRSTSCIRARTSSSSTTTCPSTRWRTVPCPSCWGVLRDVRRTRETCSTCIPGCWSGPAGSATSRGGGSITALPIIETQAGDVSAYIPDQRHLHHGRPDLPRERSVLRPGTGRP